jgi:hypothetical protein
LPPPQQLADTPGFHVRERGNEFVMNSHRQGLALSDIDGEEVWPALLHQSQQFPLLLRLSLFPRGLRLCRR